MSAPRFRIIPAFAGSATVVNFTRVDGLAVSAFSDEARTSPVTLPTTITTDTTFYFAREGRFIPSVKVGGVELTSGADVPVLSGTVGMFQVPGGDGRITVDGTTQLGYAERATNDTTTNTSYASAPSNKIAGLSVTVVGQGLPVTVEFFCPQVYHSVANTLVSCELLINGALATGQFASAFSPSTAAGPFLLMKRKPLLVAGTSYTFEVGKSVSGAGTGTYTGAADSLMYLEVSR